MESDSLLEKGSREGIYEYGDNFFANTVAEALHLVRLKFLYKVYMIFSVLLLLTVVSANVFSHSSVAMDWFMDGKEWTTILAAISSSLMLIGIGCYRSVYPLNICLVSGLAICASYALGSLCAIYPGNLRYFILGMFSLSFFIFVSYAVYCLFSHLDFSFGLAYFYAVVLVIIMGFLEGVKALGYGLSVLLFVGYILLDSSLLIHHLSPYDIAYAIVCLFVDGFNLFSVFGQVVTHGEASHHSYHHSFDEDD